MISEALFRERLLIHIRRKYGRQQDAAEAWGVSAVFVSLVLSGKKSPNKTMLEELGYTRHVEKKVYVKKKIRYRRSDD